MKKKILFDATIISSGWAKNSNRSGIFFASSNILKKLLKRSELDISLYCAPSAIHGLQIVLRDSFVEYPKLKIINENESSVLGVVQDKLIARKIITGKRRFPLELQLLYALSIFVKTLTVLQNRFYHSKALKLHINEFDIFFSPGYLAPKLIRNNEKIKRYTLLYDTIPLLFPDLSPFMKYFGYSWTKSIVEHLRPDDYCFSISEQTKRDFMDFCPCLVPARIVVTPLAASEFFYHCIEIDRIETVKKKYNIPLGKKYIFSLCTLEPRKNLLMSVKCFIELIKKNEIDDLVFVLGGGCHERFIGVIEEEINGFKKYKDKIVISGYIDDQDLAPLYSGAAFFVYPSLYEGFGLPPLEAMQCGCPVISSNISSLPEVVDNAGILIDPKSEPEFIKAMENLCFNKELYLELSRKGLERSRHFSWEKCVDIMVKEMIKD